MTPAGRTDVSASPEDTQIGADVAQDASGTATDATEGADTGLPDASPPDAGSPDAGSPDANCPDSGSLDGGGGPTAGLVLSVPMTDDPSDGIDELAGGGATVHCSNCPTLADGAYHFSGSQYITVDPAPALQTTVGFSVTIWVRPSSMGLFQVMVSKLYGSAVANSWQLSLRKATSCADRFYFETTNGSGYQVIMGADTVSIDRWWHVAATWDGKTKRLYLDGALVQSGSDTTLMDGGPIYIGCDWDNGAPAHLFHGALRDFRLYDRALSASEVAQLTAGKVAGPPLAVPGAVTDLVLVDALSDTDIGSLGSLGSVSLPPGGVNIRAEVLGAPGSIQFGLDGTPSYRVENSAPYTLVGDTSGDYNPWTPASGLHTITATPYCDSGAGGTAGTTYSAQLTVN